MMVFQNCVLCASKATECLGRFIGLDPQDWTCFKNRENRAPIPLAYCACDSRDFSTAPSKSRAPSTPTPSIVALALDADANCQPPAAVGVVGRSDVGSVNFGVAGP